MNPSELTGSDPAAKNPAMRHRGVIEPQSERRRGGPQGAFRRRALRAGRVAMLAGALGGIGGCVNVSAPDKPIVIELNINIRQEVVYRLDANAAKTIEENKDIF